MAKKHPLGTLQPGDRGYVGRGHPPEHGKILPGETRNPWGRYGKEGKPAKKRPEDFAAAMAEQLARPVPSKDGKMYTLAELTVKALTKGILSGDPRIIKLLMEMHDKYQPAKPISSQDELEARDAEILERYNRQLLLSAGLDPDVLADASMRSASSEEDAEDAEIV